MNPRTRLGLVEVVVSVLVVVLMFLAGCSEIGDRISTTGSGGQTTEASEAPDTTEATQTPDTTEAPDTEEEGWSTQRYVLLGVLALVLIVIVAIGASRRGKKQSEAPAAGPSWRTTAEQAYSQSRWLYENLTPEIALWRGDLLHRSGGQVPTPPETASAQEQTWSQLGTLMTAAITNLYNLEVQVDPASQPVVRSVIDSLNSTRTAVDEVSSARLAVLRATDEFQGDPGSEHLQQNLSGAHGRESQSVQYLNGHRSVLYGALTNLAALQ